MTKEWFETWFDTRYYHLLYGHRNDIEAHHFIDALLRFLKPGQGAAFIDVACGKGRHSNYLCRLGYKVTGIDLSGNSIKEAEACGGGKRQAVFYKHDIRMPFPVKGQDIALNLFTSFGYFDDDEEHQGALNNMHTCLKAGGRLVLDFLNIEDVKGSLRNEDIIDIEGVSFRISRKLDEKHIVKSINITDGPVCKHYEERVRAFSKDELLNMMEIAGFEIEKVFGDYKLQEFGTDSPRVIIIAKKKA